MSTPVGVILAAGRAERMGSPKQLLEYGNGTVLGAVLAAAASSRIERWILVLGSYAEEIVTGLGAELEGVEVVRNPAPDEGNMSSLLCATAVTGNIPILLVMGDMPGLAPAVIDAHLEAWMDSPAWLRVTDYRDRQGHPLMLSPSLVAGLPKLDGPRPLWAITRTSATQRLVVDAAMPIDVDTQQDYEAALARLDRG